LIKVVGVSAAGKSTLVAALREAGYDARPVSQEHAEVRDLWRQFEVAAALIYLDVTLDTQRERRTDVSWNERTRDEEVRRLAHAREHADLVIDTSALDAQTVLRIVLAWLQQRGLRHADGALPPVSPTGAPLPD
jgi:predicted ATPase